METTPGQGAKWLRNIIFEITSVIVKGHPEIRVKLIAATLTNKEKNFPNFLNLS